MTLSAMNARRLIKPRLVCECILVVWSAIYLGIAIRFWILLSMIASSFMFCPMKMIPSSESVGSWEGRSSRRTWSFVLPEFSSSSRASSFWSGEEKSPTRSKPSKHVENYLNIFQVAIPFRLLCIPGPEDSLAIAIMVCTGPYFLFFCRFKHCYRQQHHCLLLFCRHTHHDCCLFVFFSCCKSTFFCTGVSNWLDPW